MKKRLNHFSVTYSLALNLRSRKLTVAMREHLHHILAAVAASRLTRGGLALAIVFLVGSTGFVLIEGWSYFDAVYMTVVTMTTVGYEEVRPLSPLGRFFNLFVMLAGVGLMLYILTVTVQTVVEDEILRVFVRRRRMRRKIDAMKEHFILCGYGRVGREVAAAFRGEDVEVVAVDYAEAAQNWRRTTACSQFAAMPPRTRRSSRPVLSAHAVSLPQPAVIATTCSAP